MKLKALFLAMAAASAMGLAAQSQGYMDGIEYYKAGQFDNAHEILSRTLDAPETNRSLALYYIGAIDLREGNVGAAVKAFDEGITLDPKNGYNFVGLGAVALRQGNAKEAEEQFKKATKAQNKAEIYVAIARAYYDADPVAYAKEYDKNMEKAVAKDKKNSDYYIMLGDVYSDQANAEGEGSDKIGKAAEEYTQAIYFNPQAPEAYVKYSRVYRHANPQYAIDKLIELTQIAPNSAMAQRELAERYYDNDQWTRAAQQYGEYIKNPNHFIKDEERYAVLLYFGERYDESLALAKSILAKNPESAQMKRILFLDLDKLGQHEAAKAAAEDFLAMKGVDFTANDYTSYANVLHELGEYDSEITALEKAVEVNPDKTEILKDISAAWSAAGNRALKNEEPDAAHQCYIQSLNAFQRYMDGGNTSTQDIVDFASRYQNVAATAPEASEERAEAIGKAIENIDKVIELVPGNFIPVRNKARMLLVKNDNKPSEETVATYTQMLELLDADPENLTSRADTYREGYAQIASFYISQKDAENAKVWYEKMLELDPENQALKDYIEKLGSSK